MRTWSLSSRRVGREGAGRLLGAVAGGRGAFPCGRGLGASRFGRTRGTATATGAPRVAAGSCGGGGSGGQGAGGAERRRGGALGRARRCGSGLRCGGSCAGASRSARARGHFGACKSAGTPCRDTCRRARSGSAAGGRGNRAPAASIRGRNGGAADAGTGCRADRAGDPQCSGACSPRGDRPGTVVRRGGIVVGIDSGGDCATSHSADTRVGAVARACWRQGCFRHAAAVRTSRPNGARPCPAGARA